MKKVFLILAVFLTFLSMSQSQTSVALKLGGSVLGYYPVAAGTGFGLGLELKLGKKSTLGVNVNTGEVQDLVKLKFGVNPEFRYYFKSAFKGIYLGVNGTYDKFKQINDKDNDFGTYLFGVGGKVGYNWILKEKIIVGFNLCTDVLGPSRSINSAKSKIASNFEVAYKF